MNGHQKRLCGALVILLSAAFFLMAAVSQAQQVEERQFMIYGVIKTVSAYEMSFTLETGERIYYTLETIFTSMANRRVSSPTLLQPGKRVGAKVRDVNGTLTAVSIRESGEG